MKASDFLEKAKQKKTLEVASPTVEDTVPVVVTNDLDRITSEIRADLQKLDAIVNWVNDRKKQFAETRERIVKNLIYVRDNRKRLLGVRTFEEYLEGDVGVTKGYFYQVLRAYEIAHEFKKPELFENVDYRILSDISRIESEKVKEQLLRKAENLSRDDVKKAVMKERGLFEEKKSTEETAEINREKLTVKLSSKAIMKEVELLLKQHGIEIRYK
jgi:hypothetical protein